MPLPRVSVCIPVYNSAPFLREAIESVLSQDYGPYELLLVDDCSSDGSREIVASYAGRDPRIRVELNADNLGMVANWNHCLELCRGEYVHFLLGDDLLSSESALSLMTAELDRQPGVSLVASARHIVDSSSAVIRTVSRFHDATLPGRDVIVHCLEQARNLIGEPSVVMFRRRDADSGFDSRYRQYVDLEMWFRLLRLGELRYLDRPLAAFRNHDGQQTVSNVGQLLHIDEMLWLLRDFGGELAPLACWYLRRHQYARMWRQYRLGRGSREQFAAWLAAHAGPDRFPDRQLTLYRLAHPFWKLRMFLKKGLWRALR